MSSEFTSGERRHADRRRAPRPGGEDESWFGAVGVNREPPFPDDDASYDDIADIADGAAGDTGHRRAWTSLAADSSLPSVAVARMVEAGSTAFRRIYRAFVAARGAVGLALIAALGIGGLFGLRPSMGVILASMVYALLAVGLWAATGYRRSKAVDPKPRLHAVNWPATIGVDLVCFSALHVLSTSSSLNYGALLVLPVLMAGVLTPRGVALAITGAVTMVLLGAAWTAVLAGADGTLQMTQATLASTGLFVITLLAGELAGRLAREELTARGSLEMARRQARLNRLVIEEMQDGVLVVDRSGRVLAVNPAARRLLALSGLSRPAPFQLRGVPAWDGLVVTVERAFREASWPAAGRDVELQFRGDAPDTPGPTRTLRVRVRFTRKREPEAIEEFCVLFLEDVRNVQARSRQEKLAAMGRVSAGIAHEIRNPLAAISQANALLAEDATDPAQRDLMRMVSENVERLKRIVDDVVEVAPGTVPDVGVIDATAQIAQICSEWARAAGVPLGAHSMLRIDLPSEPVGVQFDAEHLRRVLVNLLDNAARHASREPSSIHLRLDSRHEAQAFLSLASDGAPIPRDVEPYLFEPFFSTRSRGTGLGLYICRELCERYGATIDYRLRSVEGAQHNEFYVDMQRRALGPTDSRLHLTA